MLNPNSRRSARKVPHGGTRPGASCCATRSPRPSMTNAMPACWIWAVQRNWICADSVRVINAHNSLPALAFHQIEGSHNLVCASPEDLGFVSNSFDAIVAGDILQQVQDDRVALRELRRVLKDGGMLCLTVPAYPFLWGEEDEARGHQRRYTASELRRKLNNCGFEISRVSYLVATGFLPSVVERTFKDLFRKSVPPRRMSDRPSRLTNAAMVALLDCERHLIRYINLPFGTRVVVLGAQAGVGGRARHRACLGPPVVAPAFAARHEHEPARPAWNLVGKLKSIRGAVSQHWHHSGDDQVGALRAHAPVWPDRRGAGGARHSQPAYFDLDRRRAGGGALGSHGLQPAGGCDHRCRQSAHARTRPSRRQAEQVIRGLVRGGHVGDPDFRCLSTESAGVLSFAGGARHRLAVLLHQALHALVARGARTGDGHCPRCRLDRGPRLARSAHPDSDRGRGFLGRGLRHPL